MELETRMKLLLLPTDPNDSRNVMLEIRAGTGGDEAAIWAGDLLGVYRKYASEQARIHGATFQRPFLLETLTQGYGVAWERGMASA